MNKVVISANLLLASILVLSSTLSVAGQCVNLPPVAAFVYTPAIPHTCEMITFDASGSYDPDGYIFDYTWDFGDNNTSTVMNPITTHNYIAQGEYYVGLTVRDNIGQRTWIVKTVIVYPRLIASFSYTPPEPQACQPVTFNASASKSEEGYIASYSWDFGDGNTIVLSDPVAIHHYEAEGTYVVTLNVTDSFERWSTASQPINVTKPLTAPPKAAFTWSPAVPESGENVTFDGSASTPNAEEISSYAWDFGDGVTEVTTQPIAYHAYQTFGSYTVTLNVTNSDGLSDAAQEAITVTASPIADFVFEPANPRVCNLVTFNASASTPDGGHILNYEWNFGDGSPLEYGIEVTHRFSHMGLYNVSLNITDSEGKWNLKTIILTVLPHLADLNEDGKVDILDMVIFALAWDSIRGHERWNPKADINGDGKVNILDGVIISLSMNQCFDYIDC